MSLRIVMILLATSLMVACGHKGNLKTPTQIQAQEAKKAKKETQKAKTSQDQKEETGAAGQ